MATYLPGLVDYIPQIQPFVPDYNFMGNILQAKQGKYDAAKKSIGDFYGKLLYSPMSKDENIKSRDEFFKSVDSQIQKLSGIDLSLQQNQDYAMNIFKPFYENEYIVKDMGWTKHRDQQIQRGEYMKTCSDPEKCGGQYWDGGMDYIKYKTKEFKDASLDESLGFDNVDFVPQQNIFPKAMKMITDAKFEVKVDSISGGYMFTDKNGENMIPALSSFLQTSFGNDPAIQKYYQVQAYLGRQQYMASVADKMSPEDALNSYYTESFKKSSENITDNDNKNKQAVDKTSDLRKAIEKHIKDKGVRQNDKATIDAYVSIVEQQEIAKQAYAVSQGNVNLIKNTSINSQNSKLFGERIDQLVANSMLNNHLNAAATQYAMNTFEHTIKGADPYSLSRFNREEDFKDYVRRAPIEVEKALAIERGKVEAKRKASQKALGEPIPNLNLPGATSESQPEDIRIRNQEGVKEVTSATDSGMVEAVGDIVNTMKSSYLQSKDPIEQGAIRTALKSVLSSSDYTPEEQLKILTGEKLFEPNRFSSSKMLRYSYERVQDILDPTTAMGLGNKSWVDAYQYKGRLLQANVASLQEQEEAFSVIQKEQSVELANELKAEWKDDPVKGLLLQSMLDDSDGISFFGSEPTSIAKQAKDFAKKYGSKIKPVNGVPGEKLAYDYAINNVKSVKEAWDGFYDKKAKSFDDVFGGDKSTRRVGEGMTFAIDASPDYEDAENTQLFDQVVEDITRNEGTAIVTYGNSGKIPSESNEEAKTVLKQILDSYGNDEKGRSRLRASITLQNIAGGNDKFMGVFIQPSEDWAKGYKGSKSAPGSAASGEYQKGIMLYLPKDNSYNEFLTKTKVNAGDMVLDKLKKIEINSIPSGKIAITKIANGYYLHGNLYAFNPETGKDEPITIDKPVYGAMIDGSTLQEVWRKDLMELHLYNEISKGRMANIQGLRSPEEIIQELQNL